MTNGNRFRVDNNSTLTMSEAQFGSCVRHNRGSVREDQTSCGGGAGKIIKVGFELNPFIELYRVCYNQAKSAPIYAVHKIVGESMKMNGKRDGHFKRDGNEFFRKVDEINRIYSQQMQMRRLRDILGNNFNLQRNYIQRGHLAAYADFSMQSWQYASNYYINVFPQWNSINNGNWKILENMVRIQAEITKRTYKVYTGTHGTLRLNLREIDLYRGATANRNRFPVPEYSWKIVVDENARSAIGFMTLNNPFIQRTTVVVDPCTNICATSKWAHPSFSRNNPTGGYTICCDVNDMMRRIRLIAGLGINVSSVMRRV